MYELSFAGFSQSFRTLLEVLRFLRGNAPIADLDPADISLAFFGHPVSVTRFNGRLTVRMPGTASSIFLSLIDEIDAAYFRPSFAVLEPWQIRREHWQLLYLAFDLARKPLYLFSSDQVAQAHEEAAKCGHRGLDLFELLQDESERRFGFRYAGPMLGNRQSNGRHEVHVAYALLAGKPIPRAVVDDYASWSEFDSDLQWAKPLVTVPELRGALSLAKLVPLVTVMRYSKQAITSCNAALLAMLMGLVPKEPTLVEVDDLLYAKGILEAHPLPAAYLKPVDVGLPTCQFAEVLRRTLADSLRDNWLAELEAARRAGSISARSFELGGQLAILDHGRHTHTFANEFAKAVRTADMSYLLRILDRPDDANRASKQAVREMFGIKLIGVPAAARRRGIFELDGMDAAQQAEWESLSVSQREARRVAREVSRAREAAEMSRIRMDDGAVLTGAEWVDRTIAEGFSQIVSVRQGASVRYALADPIRHLQVSLRANDGTLAYARVSLERRAS
ncbi:hypothetical protein AWB82_06266 [Caballeronia glebae]|uniref:Uncharacterized protein n=1 Tax=Caballeronia glebae TaxID=1777143 RepID=A0A158D483_9BURK|nr:hypothetical protein [Caballeronia glebae]SAK89418.1 hypothetical protein AWB82_06266 [Caballeronia glebae]